MLGRRSTAATWLWFTSYEGPPDHWTSCVALRHRLGASGRPTYYHRVPALGPGSVPLSQPRVLPLVARALRKLQPAQLPRLHGSPREPDLRSLWSLFTRRGGTAARGGIPHAGTPAQQPNFPQRPSSGHLSQLGHHARSLPRLVGSGHGRRRPRGPLHAADSRQGAPAGAALGWVVVQESLYRTGGPGFLAASRRCQQSPVCHLSIWRPLGKPSGQCAHRRWFVRQSASARQHAAPGLDARHLSLGFGQDYGLLRGFQRRFSRG